MRVTTFSTVAVCVSTTCADHEGGTGGPDPPPPPPPLKNHKNIGFSSNTGPDPLKNRKATMPAFNVGPAKLHLMQFRWQVHDGPLKVVLEFESSLPSSTKEKKEKKWNQSWTPSDNAFWICA